MVTIIGIPVEEGVYTDLITAAEAKLDPVLAELTGTEPRLLQLITAASTQIQRYIGYFYDEGEEIPPDLKLGCSQYVAFLWNQDQIGAAGDLEAESLGSYSYTRGRGLGTQNQRLDRIMGLIDPFVRRTPPRVVKDDE